MPSQGARRRDTALIEVKVSELQRAQQQENADDFMSLFTPDAVWVTAHGKRLTGRGEVHDFTRKVLPGAMKDSTARYEVVHTSFVRLDVVMVNVRQRPITHDGESLGGPHGSPVYVMAKEEGEWKIAAAQNTRIKESPQTKCGRHPLTFARRELFERVSSRRRRTKRMPDSPRRGGERHGMGFGSGLSRKARDGSEALRGMDPPPKKVDVLVFGHTGFDESPKGFVRRFGRSV